jgi:hypothetical protein
MGYSRQLAAGVWAWVSIAVGFLVRLPAETDGNFQPTDPFNKKNHT